MMQKALDCVKVIALCATVFNSVILCVRRYIFFLIVFLSLSYVNAQQTVGLFTNAPGSYTGYNLFAPLTNKTTYLIDNCGKYIQSWTSSYTPGNSVYLLEDGTLLRTGNTNNSSFSNTGGSGGIIERFDWDGTLLWSYQVSEANQLQHHDIEYLPNGNILAIVWEKKTSTEATDAGRNPSYLGTELWSEKIIEIQPVSTNQANIVWEWHVWDHLVQDYSSSKNNYGSVSDQPELINLNYTSGNAQNSDWLHINAVDYNPQLNQIVLSNHNFSEIWIIDHSTTTAEAASHSGGNSGKGGDLLYRWGNPQAYGTGSSADKKLYSQHDAHWIETGSDSSKIMIFNNGVNRPGGSYSTVNIITPPVNGSGIYTLNSGQAFGPQSFDWEYKATSPTDFYSQSISGAQHLPNEHTLICEGQTGHFFEVDNSGNIYWDYVNPVSQTGPVSQGTTVGTQGPGGNPIPVFRCYRYSSDYPAFDGKTLTPGDPVELNPLSYDCNISTISNLTSSENKISIYPNPSDGHFEINSINKFFKVNIFDCNGRLVDTKKEHNRNNYLYYLHKSGLYLIQIILESQIIKERILIF